MSFVRVLMLHETGIDQAPSISLPLRLLTYKHLLAVVEHAGDRHPPPLQVFQEAFSLLAVSKSLSACPLGPLSVGRLVHCVHRRGESGPAENQQDGYGKGIT